MRSAASLLTLCSIINGNNRWITNFTHKISSLWVECNIYLSATSAYFYWILLWQIQCSILSIMAPLYRVRRSNIIDYFMVYVIIFNHFYLSSFVLLKKFKYLKQPPIRDGNGTAIVFKYAILFLSLLNMLNPEWIICCGRRHYINGIIHGVRRRKKPVKFDNSFVRASVAASSAYDCVHD